MRRRKVILLSTGLWLVVACGQPLQAIPDAPIDAATIAEAAAIGASFGLWAPGRDWASWKVQAVQTVSCGIQHLPPGAYVEACTIVEVWVVAADGQGQVPAGGTISIINSLNHTDTVQALVHELYHAVVNQPDHCGWSGKASLIAAISSAGGKGGDFIDNCSKVECDFNDGTVCK